MSDNNLLIPLERAKEMRIQFSRFYLMLTGYSIFPFSFIFPLASISKFENLYEILILIGLLFIGLLWIFLILCFNSDCIVLRKDESNNLFQLQEKNILSYSRKSLMLNLKNIMGEIRFYTYKTRKGTKIEKYALIIVNKCNNITISDNFIPIVPEKLFYFYDDIKTNDIVNNIKLTEFLDCHPEGENPVFFNSLNYMGSPSTDYSIYSFKECKLSRYMKMNDKFFSFYMVVDPFTYCPFLSGIIVSDIILLGALTASFISKIIILLFVFGGVFLLLNTIFLIYTCNGVKEISRMDIIYSNNFDKLFIGLVNYNEEKYIKTFSFEINNIEKFVLETYKSCTTKLKLKAICKNKDSIDSGVISNIPAGFLINVAFLD